jgi:DNA-binding response OmpR family regulator
MKNVLIVDDDKDIRDMLVVALSAEGWVVQSATTLLGALDILAANNEIEIMLLDYNLPGMPMEDFLKQVRGTTPLCGIVLISAVDKVAEKAERVGIKHFLGKPFDFDDLRAVMAACLLERGKN